MDVLRPHSRPAWRAALVALALSACAHPQTLAPQLGADGTVVLQHRAASGLKVSVVGDFNGWEPARDPMQPGPPERYTATLHLPPGTHSYAFAEQAPDGAIHIVPPEDAPAYVDDDFGGRNGLISIPGAP